MKRGGLRWNEEAFAAFHGRSVRWAAGTINNGQKADAATDGATACDCAPLPVRTPIRADAASMPTPKPPLEAAVLKAVIRALALHPRVAWAHRMNVGAFRDADRFVRVGFKGCSDIIGQTTDGRFLAVEVKRPGGKPTPDQTDFIDRVNSAGGVAFVARSVDDVYEGLAWPGTGSRSK